LEICIISSSSFLAIAFIQPLASARCAKSQRMTAADEWDFVSDHHVGVALDEAVRIPPLFRAEGQRLLKPELARAAGVRVRGIDGKTKAQLAQFAHGLALLSANVLEDGGRRGLRDCKRGFFKNCRNVCPGIEVDLHSA